MLDLNLAILSDPRPDLANHIIISPKGDTIIALTNAPIHGAPSRSTFTFLVSSKALRKSSGYFAGAYNPNWGPTRAADGKYHFDFSDHNYDMWAWYVVLLALYQPGFSYWLKHDMKHADVGLPTTMSLPALIDVMWIVDYLLLPRPAEIFFDYSELWFAQFLRDGEWEIPDEYGEELMGYWCLALCFEPKLTVNYGDSLQAAVEKIMFWVWGPIDDFGWPIPSSDLVAFARRWEYTGPANW